MPLVQFTSPDVDNIVVGKARLFIDGTEVGYTQGGAQLRKSNEHLDIQGDQVGGKLKKLRTSEMMFLTFTMLESTLDHMRKALSEPAGNLISGSMVRFGDSDLTTTEHTVTIKGAAPGGQHRTYEFFRCIISEDFEHPIGQRDAVSVVPIAFELLKDENQNESFGHFWDSDTEAADPS